MTESEFEARLRQMAKAGGQASSNDLTGMATDIEMALEELDLFYSIDIRKTGDLERMLSVRARGRGLSPNEVMARLGEAFDREIRYSRESFRWAVVEADGIRFRFATRGAGLWASGEILVRLDSSPGLGCK